MRPLPPRTPWLKVLPLVLLVLAAPAVVAAPLWNFQLTASTSGLRYADFLAARAALTQAAVQSLAAAGGDAPTVQLIALPPPPPTSWLRGLPLALTASFRADSIQAARGCMRWFQPPPLPASAGSVYWLCNRPPRQVVEPASPPPPSPPPPRPPPPRPPPPPVEAPTFTGLRSNGTHVLRGDGSVWSGVGVNVLDDYKGGVCQGANRLPQAEVLRRISLAVDCLGAQWVRYAIQVRACPCVPPVHAC